MSRLGSVHLWWGSRKCVSIVDDRSYQERRSEVWEDFSSGKTWYCKRAGKHCERIENCTKKLILELLLENYTKKRICRGRTMKIAKTALLHRNDPKLTWDSVRLLSSRKRSAHSSEVQCPSWTTMMRMAAERGREGNWSEWVCEETRVPSDHPLFSAFRHFDLLNSHMQKKNSKDMEALF